MTAAAGWSDDLDRGLGRRHTASVGAAAIRAWRELAPDVAVLDFRLPDVDGSQLSAELRALSPGAAVVFLSASAGEEEYDGSSGAGAALVRKDAGVDALVGAVRAAAGR